MPAVTRIMDEAERRELRLRQRIGDELRQARLAAGVSQREVADALGCSAATVSRIERGLTRKVTLIQLARHAAVGVLPCAPMCFRPACPFATRVRCGSSTASSLTCTRRSDGCWK